MEHLDILAGLIVPPTPAVVEAIESGLLALDAQHVSPTTATALMQRLCSQAASAPPFVEAGNAIFQRLLVLGGNPWDQVLPDMPTAAAAALSQFWQGPFVAALRLPHPPLADLVAQSKTTASTSWLKFSVKNGLHQAAQALLAEGLDPNQTSPDEPPALHLAPDTRMVSLLLDAGADPCALDPMGRLCVQAWSQEIAPEYIDMLASMLDRGPGLDRFSLLRIAGGRPRACKPLLEGVKEPRRLADDQGRSIFFHMAATALDERGGRLRTSKQILAYMKEALSWYAAGSHPYPLDEGAAQLLLWSARVLSNQQLDQDAEQAIAQVEAACGLPVSQAKALAALDAMAEAGLLHDASEVAATALDGYWQSTSQNPISVMATELDPDLEYPGLQWLDRCFRGLPGGAWFQGQSENNRWQSPDIPIEGFRKSFLDFAHNALPTHPMWSQPDLGRVLIQLLRSDWPSGNTRYYQLELRPLDVSWSSRLRERHAPLLAKMDRDALREALNDPCCHATVMAMEGKNCHIQSLCAELAYEAMDAATPAAPARAKSGPRL